MQEDINEAFTDQLFNEVYNFEFEDLQVILRDGVSK